MYHHFNLNAALRLTVTTLGLLALPALADKPEWKEHGRDPQRDQISRQEARPDRPSEPRERSERHAQRGDQPDRPFTGQDVQVSPPGPLAFGAYFAEQQRNAVLGYYADRRSQGKCPPGLAKKKNGCQPPGQAKKWKVGYPLPRDVVYAPLPRDLSARLGVPPEGHRFVRVASDILLIAIGTGMVIDAIEDLTR